MTDGEIFSRLINTKDTAYNQGKGIFLLRLDGLTRNGRQLLREIDISTIALHFYFDVVT